MVNDNIPVSQETKHQKSIIQLFNKLREFHSERLTTEDIELKLKELSEKEDEAEIEKMFKQANMRKGEGFDDPEVEEGFDDAELEEEKSKQKSTDDFQNSHKPFIKNSLNTSQRSL